MRHDVAPAPESDAADLRSVARRLEHACRRLARSLEVAERAEAERIVEACASHLAEARRLRPILAAAAHALRSAPGDAATSPRPARRELAACVQGCVRLLRQSVDAYGRLAGRASRELAELDRELRQMQRGSQALRTYRGALR